MSYCTSCGGDHRTCDCKGKADPAPAAAPVGEEESPLFVKALRLVELNHPAVYERIRLPEAQAIVKIIETNADLHVKVSALQAEHARLAQELAEAKQERDHWRRLAESHETTLKDL